MRPSLLMACSAASLSPANGALNLDLAAGGKQGARREIEAAAASLRSKVVTMKMTIDSGEFVPESVRGDATCGIFPD